MVRLGPYQSCRHFELSKGGFKETAHLFHSLGVPTAVASDLDLIVKDELPSVVAALKGEEVPEIAKKVLKFREDLLQELSTLDTETVIKRLEVLTQQLKSNLTEPDSWIPEIGRASCRERV